MPAAARRDRTERRAAGAAGRRGDLKFEPSLQMSAPKHSLIAALHQACADIMGEVELSHMIADGEKQLAENPPPPEIKLPENGDFDPVAFLEAMRKAAPVDWHEAQAAVAMSFAKGKALGASWALRKIEEAIQSCEADP